MNVNYEKIECLLMTKVFMSIINTYNVITMLKVYTRIST